MFYMANRLGAWQIGDDEEKGRVEFKVFFPRGFDPEIKDIKVGGDFQHFIDGGDDWDFPNGLPMERDDSRPEGTFWSHTTEEELLAGFYQYKYLVRFNDDSTVIVSDPCTRYGALIIKTRRLSSAAAALMPIRCRSCREGASICAI
jgi:1,4-alpha-glucan branching enzyme